MKRGQPTVSGNPPKKQKRKFCEHPEGCGTRPSFEFRGNLPTRCNKHKIPGMINVVSKRCSHEGCDIHASYGMPDQPAVRCRTHVLAGMIDRINRRCTKPGCESLNPLFNHPAHKRGVFCKKHSEPGMLDVVNKRCCQHVGCSIQASFGMSGETRGTRCKRHMTPEMVALHHKEHCTSGGCTKRPHFNQPGEKRGVYCVKHALEGMVDVINRCCTFEACNIQPAFGMSDSKTATRCSEHKLEGMQCLRALRCTYPGCTKRPCFNFKGISFPSRCKAHKDQDMVDVVNARCTTTDCDVSASFGVPGAKATKCVQHITDGMIAQPRRRCQIPKCKSIALYGMNSIPTHCELHKAEEHINLVMKICVVCNVLERVDNEQKCARCSDYLIRRLHLRKQRQVLSWVKSHDKLNNVELYDRVIDAGACGKERPDFVWDAGTHKIILEVDEDQHQGREKKCEITRMINITGSFGMPCLWIRYNPDKFKSMQSSLTELKRRSILLDVLVHALTCAPTDSTEFLRIQHLFFDGFQVGTPLVTEKIPMI